MHKSRCFFFGVVCAVTDSRSQLQRVVFFVKAKAMRGDLEITGLIHLHSVDILYVVLVDPDSSSRQTQTIQQILHNTEFGKNRKYRDAARQHRNARFIPMAFTTSGVYEHHATTFLKTLATLLSYKWQVHYSCHALGSVVHQCCLDSTLVLAGLGPRRRHLDLHYHKTMMSLDEAGNPQFHMA